MALTLLEKALKLDPDNLPVHAFAAWCHELCFTREGFDKARRDAALNHARTAIAGNPQDATVLAVAGFVTRFFDGEHESGLATIDRGSSSTPRAQARSILGRKPMDLPAMLSALQPSGLARLGLAL